jgi:dTDP-4-dehydrorhamnose 3,5-epimerase
MSVVEFTPRRFEDDRGWFVETWQSGRFEAVGIAASWCQDNHSLSRPAYTMRGLHFQHEPMAQAKLVRCLRGRVFDVAVDIRAASPTYRQWVAVVLTADKGNQLFIPAGFAHGFLTLEDNCEIAYKVDNYYSPDCDGGIAWDDPDIAIDWPLNGHLPLLSAKDQTLPRLADAVINFGYDGVPLALIG